MKQSYKQHTEEKSQRKKLQHLLPGHKQYSKLGGGMKKGKQKEKEKRYFGPQ
jgi:hypothetical protein